MAVFSCESENGHNFSSETAARTMRQDGNMSGAENMQRWAVILAGGDGTRLQTLTRTISGDKRPKQFCPIIGGRTLLDQTRRRVTLAVPPERTLTVVTQSHELFYKPLLKEIPNDRLLEQPQNKGTAPAILLSLLRVAQLSPNATVAFFPSDHFFTDDAEFMSHIDSAFCAVQSQSDMITLLGIEPESPEAEYGWIEPVSSLFGQLPRAISRVRKFWEKPPEAVAQRLMRRGCLWNSFVMIGHVEAFLSMTQRALPDLYESFAAIAPTFGTDLEAVTLNNLYSWIPSTNFSHEVLASRPEDLTVMRVSDVGWSDLGEPGRVFSTLRQIGLEAHWAMPVA